MRKLIICIDGLGFDLVSSENTPFLYNFAKKNSLAVLKTYFAFTGIEYSFFIGKEPEEIGIWLEFSKTENSIFNNPLLRFFSFSKKLRTYLAASVQFSNNRTYIASLHNIPKEKLKYFDSSAKTGLWKLPYFQEKSFSFYKWPFLVTKNKNEKEKTKVVLRYENDEQRLERLTREKDKEVYYTQLMSIDKTIHKFGKKSKETKRALLNIDRLMEKHISQFLSKNPDAEIVIWGDHGFADIKNYIDIEKLLPDRRDYLAFIAGTTVSFWFKSEEARKEVLKALSKVKEGRILTVKDARKYKIPFSGGYGELVFYVKKGNYFFPNFYQEKEGERFLAMHGYPDDRELDGVFITNSKREGRVNKSLKINEVRKIL